MLFMKGLSILFTWKEIINIAIRIENNGEQIYRQAARKIADPDLSAALIHMADEEARHAKWFSTLPLPDTIDETNSDIDKMSRIFIHDAMADKALSLETADLTAMKHVRELIHTSIEFEQDTILFFEMIRQFVTEEASMALIDTIIAEEKKHITTLEDWIQPDHVSTLTRVQ
jgi:rubrerythrin